MKCLECGKEFKSISSTHLKKCCGLTPQEYSKKHGVPTQLGLHGSQNHNWRGKGNRTCKVCGASVSRNAKKSYCAKHSPKNGKNNPFYGKQHTNKTKSKMSQSQKIRDSLTRKIPKPTSRKSSKTKIELKVADILTSLNIKFLQTEKIGSFYVDFLVGRTVIECYGDYWHCNPIWYAKDFYNKQLKMTAEKKWILDQNRIQMLDKLGYKVLIFWEDDIDYRIKEVKNKLKEVFDVR